MQFEVSSPLINPPNTSCLPEKALLSSMSAFAGTGAAIGGAIIFPFLQVSLNHTKTDTTSLVLIGLFTGSLCAVIGHIPAMIRQEPIIERPLSKTKAICYTASVGIGAGLGVITAAALRALL